TIETLTNRIEREATELLARIDAAGGALVAIETGYIQQQIQDAAYRAQQAIDSGEAVVVGVNRFGTGDSGSGTRPLEPRVPSPESRVPNPESRVPNPEPLSTGLSAR
ncbi:MAG: methylmalonyl-CoA mutase, partial [Acidobacteria bacterium]|nr:methylmalonyl-CoA mutase [Acidobacteriota bacterium]